MNIRNLLFMLLSLLLLAPMALGEGMLDLSQFEGGEPPAAEHWEDAVFETRPWYEREDGTDWRVLSDGSIVVTVSATGDVTIGGDTRKRNKSIFDKQLEQEAGGLAFPMENVKDVFEADDMTIVNFEGTLTTTRSATKNTYSFAAPPEYVQVLTTGNIEAVSLENNHIMDHGDAGYEETCKTLENAGIVFSGHLGSGMYTTDTGVNKYQRNCKNGADSIANFSGDSLAMPLGQTSPKIRTTTVVTTVARVVPRVSARAPGSRSGVIHSTKSTVASEDARMFTILLPTSTVVRSLS